MTNGLRAFHGKTQAFFEKDGIWLAHFLCIEGASVVEYKYVISKKNGVARLRRVLIDGPENPVGHGAAAITPQYWPAEKQKRWQTFMQCNEFLMSQTMKNEAENTKASVNGVRPALVVP